MKLLFWLGWSIATIHKQTKKLPQYLTNKTIIYGLNSVCLITLAILTKFWTSFSYENIGALLGNLTTLPGMLCLAIFGVIFVIHGYLIAVQCNLKKFI